MIHGYTIFLLLGSGLLAQLPPGRITSSPKVDEVETVQAGGKGWNRYVFVGELRCERPGDALVGLTTRHGTVLDYLALTCAPVKCTGANCSWTNPYDGRSGGNLAGGGPQQSVMCRSDEMVSGYRASVRNFKITDFAADVEIECAKITGPARGHGLFPISRDGREWRHPTGHLAGSVTGGTCSGFGATAVSVAIGKYPLNNAHVVQAMSLFCGTGAQGPSQQCPASQAYFPELASLYGAQGGFCSQCCRPCALLSTSADPVSGNADRAVRDVPVNRYNCHFYTLWFVNMQLPPDQWRKHPQLFDTDSLLNGGGECLSDEDLAGYGYRKIQAGAVDPRQMREGDIVTVYKTSLIAQGCRNAHSGVVVRANAATNNIRIRQKPDPTSCVVDLNWDEFRAVFGLNQPGYRANGWRR
jgi:hypothetical protein